MTEPPFDFDDEPQSGGIGVALLLLIPMAVLVVALFFALTLLGVHPR